MSDFRNKRALKPLAVFLALMFAAGFLLAGTAGAQPVPRSLKDVRPIEPPQLHNYLKGTAANAEGAAARAAAIQLGKALLWDMQVGSDGLTACASCHFRAGTDHRVTNTLHPGANRTFNVSPVNSTIDALDFPFHDRLDPLFQSSPVIRNLDDTVGAQGVKRNNFVSLNIVNGEMQADEIGTPVNDPVFGLNRQVTGKNSPTYINAALTFTLFHNGRANNVYNGVNVWGPADPNAAVFVDNAGVLGTEKVRMRFGALASQAMDPPVSAVEMSYAGRRFPQIGKKMLNLTPLGKQEVHPQDSVLGSSSLSPNPGLSTSYATLIQAAFRDRFWANNTQKITYNASGVPTVNAGAPPVIGGANFLSEFSQMEANFSLFFGIALQVYQMTLLADDSKFDQFLEGAPGVLLTAQEERGFELFALSGCGACHENPEFTAHAQRLIQFISSPNQNPSAAIGVERQVKFGDSYVDEGIYNIGVRPTGEDIGRGGRTAPGFDTRPAKQRLAKDGSFPLSFTELAVALRDGKLPLDTGDHTALAEFVPPLPTTARAIKRTEMVKGAFKVPTLHNIEVLGPFFHNGSVATLSQVIDFYARGGNFPATNARELHPAIIQIPTLQFGFDEITPPLPPEAVHESIVSFLLTLTDERVKEESGVFDRPQIFIPNWVPAPGEPGVVDPNFEGSGESFAEIPAVGTGGREAFGVDGNGNRVFPPIGSFMDLVQ